MTKRLTQLNLLSVFVIAFALTTFLHELAHAIAALLMGVDPILYHTYVSYVSSTSAPQAQLYIAAAGPAFSLIQALSFLYLIRVKKCVNFTYLLCAWMSVMGMVVFLGYVMMGPVVPYGDTGKIYSILQLMPLFSWLLAGVALVIIIVFFRRITPILGSIISCAGSGYDSRNVVWDFFTLAIIQGTVINILLSLPAPTTISLLFPVVISLTLLPSILRIKGFLSTGSEYVCDLGVNSRKIIWPVIGMLVLLLLSRVLALGIPL